MLTYPLLHPEILRALGEAGHGSQVLIADGTKMTFCDSAGIATLIHAHRQAAATGAQLRVVITSTPVRRILEIIGADQLLLVYPSLPGAQADRSQPAPSAADPAPDPERQEIA